MRMLFPKSSLTALCSKLRIQYSSQACQCGPPASLFSPEIVDYRRKRLSALLNAKDTPESFGVTQPEIRALLVDAAGTLIAPSEPAAAVYLRYAAPYGCAYSEEEILAKFRSAFSEPWTETVLRYDGDGRRFWRHVVGQATGCTDDQMHDDVYRYFGLARAWKVFPGAVAALKELRKAGFRLAVVSNFDTRLRPLLDQLHLSPLFDEIIVSAEVKVEKPNPIIFEIACKQLGVEPEEALILGDDRRNDISGGREAGCNAWLFGIDVKDFDEASDRLQRNQIY